MPAVRRVVTATTRPPRPGEVHGTDYRFLTREAFEDGVRHGGFLEHAEVHGHFYGTPRAAVEESLARGGWALLAIDVQGARQLRDLAAADPGRIGDRMTTVFLLPPDEETLAERLRRRGTESASTTTRRLEAARREIEERSHYDCVVVNDDLDRAVREIREYLGID
jgi:guanylate kinase